MFSQNLPINSKSKSEKHFIIRPTETLPNDCVEYIMDFLKVNDEYVRILFLSRKTLEIGIDKIIFRYNSHSVCSFALIRR